jgi:hypothetical protein
MSRRPHSRTAQPYTPRPYTPQPYTPQPYTRRSFLGRAAAAAVIPGAAAVAASCSADPAARDAAPSRQPRPPRKLAENSRPGDPRWDVRHLGSPDAIMGYAGRFSVLAGESVPLFVSTTSRSFRVLAFRTGWYGGDLARLVWQSGNVRGHRQRRPSREHRTNTVTTDWGPSLTVPTHDWPEGAYLLRLDADSGAQRFVPLTVRSASTAGKVVIKNSVATWQAYNMWGGYDLYNGPAGLGDYASRSLAVSLDRPYDHEGAYLFLIYERKVIELAERIGLPLAYATNLDLAGQPRLLTGASALISLGHDEYWSPAERATVTAARDSGVNIAFLGANASFRRTRLTDSKLGAQRTVICYKTSYLQDPMYGKDNALVTSDWREPPHADPESSLTGTLYESNPTTADFVVTSPDAWVFHGTGVRAGTRFRGLVGTEYDRVNPGFPVQRPIEVTSHSPLTCRGVNSYADSAYYTHRGGAGVFNTGTMRWVQSLGGEHQYGLDRRTARFTRQVTANVLRAFADGPAAARHPARDNLRQTHEWAGDPIGTDHDLWSRRHH